MKKTIITLLCVLVLTGCNIVVKSDSEIKESNNKVSADAYITINKEIEVFKKTKLIDVIDTNVQGIDENLLLDTSTIGENTMIVDCIYNNVKGKYELKYTVVDKTMPIYLSASSSIYLTLNSDKDPCDSINIADNYSKEPVCSIEGEYNTSKLGTYNVKYVISDESNNINKRNLTINVVKTIPSSPSSPPSTPTSTQFSWVMNKFKNDNTEIGLDVSRWQGDIDFEKVKAAGATFVMMRMGVSNKPEEALAVDSKFKQNISRAKAAGLKVGVYIYTAAINDEMAKTLADFAVQTLDGETLDFPIVFDFENWSKFRSYKISIHDLNQTFVTFANELKKNNLDAMLYGSKHYLEIMWEDELKDNYPVWLAHYTNNQSSYAGKYMMWQMCSDGRIDGIDGAVDIDILYK